MTEIRHRSLTPEDMRTHLKPFNLPEADVLRYIDPDANPPVCDISMPFPLLVLKYIGEE
jgi:hypothetical protein